MKAITLHYCERCKHSHTVTGNRACNHMPQYIVGYYSAGGHYHPYNWGLNDLPKECPFILEYLLQ